MVRQPADRGTSVPGDLVLPPAARSVIGVLGVMAVAAGLFLFVLPERAIDLWPWTITPLMSRVLGAIFMLGLAGLGVFFDPRWGTARFMLQVQSIMMALILVAAARARRDFDTSNAMTWLVLGGFAAALVAAIVLTVKMDARAEPRA